MSEGRQPARPTIPIDQYNILGGKGTNRPAGAGSVKGTATTSPATGRAKKIDVKFSAGDLKLDFSATADFDFPAFSTAADAVTIAYTDLTQLTGTQTFTGKIESQFTLTLNNGPTIKGETGLAADTSETGIIGAGRFLVNG